MYPSSRGPPSQESGGPPPLVPTVTVVRTIRTGTWGSPVGDHPRRHPGDSSIRDPPCTLVTVTVVPGDHSVRSPCTRLFTVVTRSTRYPWSVLSPYPWSLPSSSETPPDSNRKSTTYVYPYVVEVTTCSTQRRSPLPGPVRRESETPHVRRREIQDPRRRNYTT